MKLFFLFLAVSLTGCAVHSNLVPLGEGKVEADLGAGGSFIPVTENKIPAPYAVAGLNYGITDNINATGKIHITSLFYKIAGFEAGAAYFPLINDGFIPAVGIQTNVVIFSSLKSKVAGRFRIYPYFTGSAAWSAGWGLIYTGVDLITPLSAPDYKENPESVIVSPFVGYKWDLGNSYNLYTEFKVQGANINSAQSAVEYIAINHYGALSFLVSISRSF